MTENRNQIHYRIDTLLEILWNKGRGKIDKILESARAKDPIASKIMRALILRYIIVYSNIA